jgi:hypothetical protein
MEDQISGSGHQQKAWCPWLAKAGSVVIAWIKTASAAMPPDRAQTAA